MAIDDDEKDAPWRWRIVKWGSVLTAAIVVPFIIRWMHQGWAHPTNTFLGIGQWILAGVVLVFLAGLAAYGGFWLFFIIAFVLIPKTREECRAAEDKRDKERQKEEAEEKERLNLHQEELRKRRQQLTDECDKAAAWGFTGSESQLRQAYLLMVTPFLSERKAGDFLFRVDLTKARSHPQFAKLVLRTAEEEFSCHIRGKVDCSFAYPMDFAVSWKPDAVPYVKTLTSVIGELSEADHNSVMRVLAEEAERPGKPLFPNLIAYAQELKRLDVLEGVFRKTDSFYNLLAVLVLTRKWDDAVQWLQEHQRFCEPVFVLEKAGRYDQAAEYLQKLAPSVYREFDPNVSYLFRSLGDDVALARKFDPANNPRAWSPQEQEEAYNRKLSALRSFASVALPPPISSLSLHDIEDKYTYGEITKEEYERLKTSVSSVAATCLACGKSVRSSDRFCAFCGARIGS